ncbi:MAG: 1-acyl-sn-glycerol-3-phosphate acyltransferase [Gammaproteobacteria bacterium]|nr:1-acyl-sn-glycerol-3-phosphate acyltransferase [Gammaproteobacteria bacterium]
MSNERTPSMVELYVRSVIYWLASVLWLAVVVTATLLAFPFSVHVRYAIASSWAKVSVELLRIICKVNYKVEGMENIPQGAAIVMAKHQSTWETFFMQKLLPPQLWVVKRELLRLPVFGWGLALCEPIAIDRSAGRKAVEQMVEQGKKKLDQGRWIIIFPEGTRVAPGKRNRYKIGGSILASQVDYPVVPIAHNAGEYWPRHSLIKWPGTITVVIGPAINGFGRQPEAIKEEVETWIENKMDEISDKTKWNR